MYLLSYLNQLLFITEAFNPESLETTCVYPLYKEEVILQTKDLHVVTSDYKPKVMELQPNYINLIHQRTFIVADVHVKRKRSYAKKSTPKKKTLQQLITEASPEELPELLAKHGYA